MKKLVKNENAPQIRDIYEDKVHDEYMDYIRVKIELIKQMIELIEKL